MKFMKHLWKLVTSRKYRRQTAFSRFTSGLRSGLGDCANGCGSMGTIVWNGVHVCDSCFLENIYGR